jgi:hypothetical protein
MPLEKAVLAFGLISLLVGCATPESSRPAGRRFDFARDTFAYPNNNRWIYEFGPDSGTTITHRREGHIEHTQRCTVMSRSARQFLYGARFAPDEPPVGDAEYRSLVRAVLDSDPRREGPAASPVTIPGYPDLRSLSRERESMLKEEMGGEATGYRQRGNWRMIFAFSPRHQRGVARELVEDLRRGHSPLVHILTFPKIEINHTTLVFAFEETPLAVYFQVYDPNEEEGPVSLVFDRASGAFHFARSDFFRGGPTKVYEVYDGLIF